MIGRRTIIQPDASLHWAAVPRMTLPQLVSYAKQKATALLLRDGHHSRVMIALSPKDVDAAPAVTQLDDRDPATARREALEAGAPAVLTIAEAWASPGGVSGWGLTPSEDPDRREVLVLEWEFVGDEGSPGRGVWLQPFRRSDSGVELDDPVELDGDSL